MTYSKKIMSASQVCKETGIGKYTMLAMCHDRRQKFACKTRYGRKWQIDTEKFDKYLEQLSEETV